MTVPIHKHGFPGAGVEAGRLPVAAKHPGDDQAAEEQHFGGEEQPHAGQCGIRLVARVGELEVRMRARSPQTSIVSCFGKRRTGLR